MLLNRGYLILILVISDFIAHGQIISPKIDTISIALFDSSTAEQLLQLPTGYNVESLTMIFSCKGELFQSCIPAKALHTNGMDKFVQSIKGCKLILDNIRAIKGNRKLKLMGKSFVLE